LNVFNMKPVKIRRIFFVNRYYLMLILFFISGKMPAAQNSTDSLFSILEDKSSAEKDRMVAYTLIATEYNKINNDSAGYYANLGYDLAKKSDDINFQLKNLVVIGSEQVKRDSLTKAKDTYLKAAVLIDKATDNTAILSVWIILGYIYEMQDNIDSALVYYFKGLNVADSLGIKRFVSRFENNIGAINIKTKNHRNAITHFFRAAEIFKELNEEDFYANTLLNIGSEYYSLKMNDSAMIFLNRSKEINEKLHNHYGLVNYYINMAGMQYDAGNFNKALGSIKLGLKEIDSLDKSFFGTNAYNRAGALIFLGEIYYKLNKDQKAIESYMAAKALSEKSSFLKYIAAAYKGLSKVYEKEGKIKSAYSYFKLYRKYDDSVKNEQNTQKISQLEMEFKFNNERKRMQLEKERAEYKRKITGLFYLSITGALITALIIITFLYLRQKDKHKQTLLKEKNLQLERESLGKELELKNKELTTNVMYLLKKNEFISDISSKLKKIDSQKGLYKSSDIVNIIRELERNTSGDVWQEFEKRFLDVYGDFYERLSKRYPNLTPNELKLSAFLKLNMSTKEISSITYQSPESLKTARHRLRKKLGLTKDDNLVAFLNQI